MTHWEIQPNGRLDEATINRIDNVAGEFVSIVQGEGSAIDIARLTRGMSQTHVLALAISIASLVPAPSTSPARIQLSGLPEGWSAHTVREAHAAYIGGDRRTRTVEGERIYQRLRGRHRRAEAKSQQVAAS